MKRIDVAYTFIYNESERRVLMVKNKRYNNWSMPGGAVEKGETLAQAAVREAFEETGLTVEVGPIVAINEAFMKKDDHHAVFFTFRAHIVEGDLNIQDTNTIEDVQWIPVEKAEAWMPYHPDGITSMVTQSVPYQYQGKEE